MLDTRILLIEDEPPWQEILTNALRRGFGADVRVDIAAQYSEVLARIQTQEYDSISIDLAFPDVKDLGTSDLPGMLLLKEIRSNPRTRSCGLIILSGQTTVHRVREALKSYKVFDFLDKFEFKDYKYLEAAKCATRDALLERAITLQNESYRFSISYDNEKFLRAQLTGQSGHASYLIKSNSPVRLGDFARQADTVNARLSRGEIGDWRQEARSIGEALYNALASHAEFVEGFTAARTLTAKRPSQLTLEFAGPPEGLSLPFELLRRGSEYFVLDHVTTRRIEGRSKLLGVAEPFSKFIESLLRNSQTLRVLIVGSNSGGTIPGAEEEAESVADFIETRLEQGEPSLITSPD